jgi:GNAT superfamily N-acetyltransferase
MEPDAIARAALFPWADAPPLPAGHPDRVVQVSGVHLGLDEGAPFAFVLPPEEISALEVERIVDEVRDVLRREGRTRGVWFVPEAAKPVGLALRLQELGMTPNDEAPFEPRFVSMATVQPPPAGPFEIDSHPVRSLDEFRAALRVSAAAFAMEAELAASLEARAEPLWPFESGGTFVATIDGEVVGSGTARFGRTAGLLNGSGTHPQHRGRGVYTSLVRARWDAAVERGTPALTVGAGAMSRPILERLGFSIIGWNDILRDDLA